MLNTPGINTFMKIAYKYIFGTVSALDSTDESIFGAVPYHGRALLNLSSSSLEM